MLWVKTSLKVMDKIMASAIVIPKLFYFIIKWIPQFFECRIRVLSLNFNHYLILHFHLPTSILSCSIFLEELPVSSHSKPSIWYIVLISIRTLTLHVHLLLQTSSLTWLGQTSHHSAGIYRMNPQLSVFHKTWSLYSKELRV
jgi:hypothetical protein